MSTATTDGLLDALDRLDGRLELATGAAAEGYATGERLPDVGAELVASPAGATPFDDLARAFGLEAADVELLTFAAAAELDDRFCPATVGFALALLCVSRVDRLQLRSRLVPSAPLIRHGLLTVREQDGAFKSTLVIDEQILAYLLGDPGLDARLRPWCTVTVAHERLDRLGLDGRTLATLKTLLTEQRDGERPLRVCLHGSVTGAVAETARALARALRIPLLTVDYRAAGEAAPPAQLVGRQARLLNAALLLRHADVVREDPQAWDQLVGDTVPVIVEAERPWRREDVVDVGLAPPTFEVRRRCWRSALRAAGAELPRRELDELAHRFRLGRDQIEAAVAAAAPVRLFTAQHLTAAARAQTGDEIAALTRRLEPRFDWDDIVLPPDSRAQLRELCQRVTARDRVLDGWGFRDRLAPGVGVSALFAGPSGTGKTMAAEVIARELGLDLYAIDLAGVVSKYIGETEKNLDRIFAAAEGVDAILFFDEADALFGKRSEVRDSHDRYANVEVSYLLQKMESHSGIAILATNLQSNLDDAFTRRLAFMVHFPFPDEDSRRQIWERAWPAGVPIADDVDAQHLAREHRLTGGAIKNVAVAAAYLAAGDGGCVSHELVGHAVGRELQKLGKGPQPEEPAR